MNSPDSEYEKMKLSQKEQFIELTAFLVALLLLVGCMLKVVFL